MALERGKAGKMILSKLESDRVNKILQENNEICKSYWSQNPQIKTLFSVEGGGDSGKDDTSDKDMEEEEECKSSLL